MLITTGYNKIYLDSIELYDSSIETWTNVSNINDGQMLICDKYSIYISLDSAKLYQLFQVDLFSKQLFILDTTINFLKKKTYMKWLYLWFYLIRRKPSIEMHFE